MASRVYTREGSRFYWLEYSIQSGKTIRESSKTTNKAEAEKLLKQRIESTKSLSFKAVVEDFFETRTDLKTSSLERYQDSLIAVDPYFGGLALSDIKIDTLKAFVFERRKKVSASTVRRDLAFVSTIFSHAIEAMVGGPDFNPVKMLPKKRLKERKGTRWLRWEEYERLLKHCTTAQQRLLIKTAVLTGMRHSELAMLTQAMIDFPRRQIVLPPWVTKRARERVIPLVPELCAELSAHCARAPAGLVFHRFDRVKRKAVPFTTFNRSWQAIRRRAGLKDVRFHDLRHTFGSWWVQAGGDLYPLMQVMGHDDLTTTQRYAHLDSEAAHRSAAKVFEHILTHRAADSEEKGDVSP